MAFADLDRPAVARALSQIAAGDGDLVDAYFEELEEVELPPDGAPPGLRVRRERGFAVRLVRDGRTWLAGRDEIEPRAFGEAVRQVARVLPTAAYPEPRLGHRSSGEAPEASEILELPSQLNRAVRRQHVAFPLGLTVKRHRRTLQVVGLGPVPEPQQECFYSLAAELPWGRWGTLLPVLGEVTADTVARALVGHFRARHATPPDPFTGVLVLAPAATAVLLHEAVGHALEADVLAQGGDPEAAVGVEMGSPRVSVLDDPAAAPEGVRRETDDEGMAVRRRWLLREGVVVEPLADALWARASEVLSPGAGRRSNRHCPPGPRSTHLELLPGETEEEKLLADAEGGLFLPEARRGRLDPTSGVFRLEIPFGRRIRGGTPADPVGPLVLETTVAELLSHIAAVGVETRAAGAGWCAKGGQRLPVWASTPSIRIEGIEARPA